MNLEDFLDILRIIGVIVLIFGGFYLFVQGITRFAFVRFLAFVLIGGVYGWDAWDTYYYEEQMLKSAEVVPARVTNMKKTQRRRGTSLTIYLAYTSPVDGTAQTDYANIRTFKAYEEIAIGDIVDLRVSIEDPSVTLLERYYPPGRSQFYTLMVVSIFFIGGGIISIPAGNLND